MSVFEPGGGRTAHSEELPVDFLRQLLIGSVQAWKRLSLSARVNLALAALTTIGLVVFMVVTASRPQYVRLYDGVPPKETTQITDIISQAGVSYKLEDAGRTILVPQSRLSDMKVAVSAEGLPSSHGAAPGFESFEQQGLMTNRMLHDVKYMRAVQGELSRHLNEFSFVNQSFVFIREAKEELFTAQQEPTKAAVTLDVSRRLTDSEIQGVLHTISSFGGPYLSIDNITLMTTKGETLYLPATSEFASIANNKLTFIAELEKQREDRIRKDFADLGIRAVVRVSANVDFDQQTESKTKSEDGAVLSAQTITNETKTVEALPRGAAGATENLPEGGAAPGGATTTDLLEETTENFEPTITKTETIKSPGEVKSYAVSVILEGDTKPALDADGNPVLDADGKPRTEYVPLTQEQKTKWENHVIAAVGHGQIPTTVTISDHPFDITRLAEARTAFEAIERARLIETVLQYVMNAGKVALILLLFWLARRILRRAIVVPSRTEEGASLDMPKMSTEDQRREEVFSEVNRISRENPDVVASLIRSWMVQEEE
ncbi:MAG: flagellar M-ring protein FliF [Nitrospiraceae bacterium]|nr:flagellar M-ring protein FliF [Nitrospiraceae bacterium]